MAFKAFNRVRVATATTGQGTITLGEAAAANMLTLAEAGAENGDETVFVIEEGTDFEIARGTVGGSATTVTRDQVLVSKISGSAGAGKMELAGGATVRFIQSAEDINELVSIAPLWKNLPEGAAKTTGYTLQPSDAGTVVAFNSTGTVVASLPAVGDSEDEVYFIRNINTGAVQIDPNSTEQIEGASTLRLQNGDMAIVWPNSSKASWRAMVTPRAGKTVRADVEQSLSAAEQTQAQANIGALGGKLLEKSADYTVQTSDNGGVILVSASANRTITLPPAASAGAGFKVIVKKTDSAAITTTIDGNGSETIDGAATKVLRLPGQSAALICDGSAWHTMAEGSVFESGSGPNGNYSRWADGTQICTISATLSTSSPGVPVLMAYNWTFPAAFASSPSIAVAGSHANGDNNGGDFRSRYLPGHYSANTTDVVLSARLISGQTEQEGTWSNFKATASGRWF